MKINTPEIYDPDHLPDDLKKEIAKLAIIKQAGVDDVCKDDPIERGLVNAHILNTIGQNVSEPGYDDAEADGQRKLSLEEAEKTGLFTALQTRFKANKHLHYCISWSDVKISLERSPEALWSLAQMESAGHTPDIYHVSEYHYHFGTCSKESPESARNCVYDKEAVDWLKENHPDVQFNGSAVEMAEAMGIELMPPEHYENILQKKGRFDEKTLGSWLLTHSDIRSTGDALIGDRSDGGDAYVFRYDALSNIGNGGWRGSLKVKKVT